MSELERAAQRAAREREERTSRDVLRARGIVPTPSEVARHAVLRIDALLRSELGLAAGLASEQVTALDPAVGTGVWLAALLAHTRARGASGLQLVGIDVEREPLDAVRALLEPDAEAQGARLSLRCENTLALAAPFPDDDRVRVILGNPPWGARSLSRGCALSDAWLDEFRRDADGRRLGERRAGVLSDDYVRFFRWALEQARTAPRGALVCFATNGSFLDGPVHRGMRGALLAAFDRIELLDLGGNTLLSRPPSQPDATPARDESVFGVRVGSALTWAVRRAHPGERRALVSFAELRGARADKLAQLAGEPPRQVLCVPSAPWFRFRPEPAAPLIAGFSLPEALPFHREGVQTNRDALTIADSPTRLTERLDAIVRGELPLPAARHFDPVHARRALEAARARGEPCVAQLAYRPLDTRYFAPVAPLCHRPRGELLRAVGHSSLCLLAVRKERGGAPFNLFAPARLLADACFLSTRSSCRTRVFPSHDPDGAPNLAAPLAARLGERLGRAVSSVDVLLYALSVLGSPGYRARHEAALKRDYAQLPWPQDGEQLARALGVGQAFVSALLDEVALPTEIVLSPTVAPGERLDVTTLAYCAQSRRVTQAGRTLLSEVQASWWTAQVGHHRLVMSALRAPGRGSLSDLVDALARAARWVAAEAEADVLHRHA